MSTEKLCEKGTVKSMVDRLSKDFGGPNRTNELPIMRPNRDRVNVGGGGGVSAGVGSSISHSAGGSLTISAGSNTTNTTSTVAATNTAVVRFSYAAQQPDELELKEGDELLVLEHVEDGWARGEIIRSPSHPTKKGRIGLYPTNFVSTISATSLTQTPPQSSTTTTLPRLIDATQEKSDMIGLVSTGGIMLSSSAPKSSSSLQPKNKEYAKVLYKYDAAAPDELSLLEGVIVLVVTRQCEDDGWFVAEFDGRRGLFPDNFVKFLPAELSSSFHQTMSNSGQQPPSLPAKPLKFQHQHYQTQLHQPTPVANTRDSLSVLMSSSAEKTTNTTNITASDMENNNGNNNLILGANNNNNFAGNRRSAIASLQNKLFPDGKFPQLQRPSSHNATSGERSPTTTTAEISVEPKMIVDLDGSGPGAGSDNQLQLLISSNSSIVKSRTGIAPPKKRRPSKMNPASMIISPTTNSNNLISDILTENSVTNYQNHLITEINNKPIAVAQLPSQSITPQSIIMNGSSNNNNNKSTVFPSQPLTSISTNVVTTSTFSPICSNNEEQQKSKFTIANLSPSGGTMGTSTGGTTTTTGMDIGWMQFVPGGLTSSGATNQWINREEFEQFQLDCQRKFSELQTELRELRRRLETAQNK